MIYYIQFPSLEAMWDFQEEYVPSNYHCNNVLFRIELDEKIYNKEEMLEKAKIFQGEELIYEY